ncbi:MAG: pyrroline-5-carboxylate reductase [Enterovibrio sp.]
MFKQQTIAFLGAGNMALALIKGLILHSFPAQQIIAVNRNEQKNKLIEQELKIKVSQNAAQSAQLADIVVLGVKPQDMSALVQSLPHVEWNKKLVISIAAGVTCQKLITLAGAPLQIVRAMPNTPAMIGEGMTGLFAASTLAAHYRQFASELFCAAGKVCWVEQEADINVIIAAAGSAPAYFFLFMQAMQEEAQRLGMNEQDARQLVQQAALGAAALAKTQPENSFAKLREQVTSKGGTTAAAIAVFEKANLQQNVAAAMQAAIVRAQEMESLF